MSSGFTSGAADMKKGNGSFGLHFLSTLYWKVIYDDKGEILRRLPRMEWFFQVKVDSPIAQLVRALH